MPKFYHSSDGKFGFNYWARGTRFRRILNFIPYFDDASVRIHLKIEFIKERWKDGSIYIQPGRITKFSKKNARCIDTFEVIPVTGTVWDGDRIFNEDMREGIDIGKHRLFLILQKEIIKGNHKVEQSSPAPIVWLNMVDRGDWFFNKTTQIITILIAIAALIFSIVRN
jgi:hypothetical protein